MSEKANITADETKPKQKRRDVIADKEAAFEKIKGKIAEELEKYRFMEIEGAKLYFIDWKGVVLFSSMKMELESHFTAASDERRYGFGLILKLLNPVKPAQNYHVGVKGKHRQMSKAETVLENIDGEFAVWKNKMRKDAREKAALHSMGPEEVSALEKELTKRIIEAEAHYNYIKDNFNSLAVQISGYAHEKLYPYISYYIDGKLNSKHLSIITPTALYYESVKYRKDMKIDEFIKHAKNAFGDVYYMEKAD